MLPIRPHLWFGKDKAYEAAEFYTSLLPGSAVDSKSKFGMGSGECHIAEFTVAGQPFMGISAESALKFTPAISFMINFDPSRDADAAKRIDEVWAKLTEGGMVMMPLDRYPFSERYGWVADKYGLSWQLILTNPAGEERPVIVPSMMFTGEVVGRADEAINFYTKIFKDGKRGNSMPYPAGREPDKEGTTMFADFYADGTWFAAMDSAHPHGFAFNDAASLLVPCETQEEIDYLWDAFSVDGKTGQCGWLKDKFGVSWQVASTAMLNAMRSGTPEQVERVVAAFMPMTKIDIATIQRAFDGNVA
ncbi:MAG TPA: VOC family protein [Mucilaginibacter sp.]